MITPSRQDHSSLHAAVGTDIHCARKLHTPRTGTDDDCDDAEHALMVLPECEF